jgi:type II restriction enzyme
MPWDGMKSTIEINGPTTDYSLRETLASAGTLPYFEDHLQTLHPDNRHVPDKIRQQIQVLRDVGLVEFLGRSRYRSS